MIRGRCDIPGCEQGALHAGSHGPLAAQPVGYCAPLRCYCRECPSWKEDTTTYANGYAYAALDARAIASGKRRSNPAQYAQARAEMQSRKGNR